MEKKRLSVAIATYKGENFIEQQLQSIIDQTCPVDEIIIRDDRSPDNTAEVIRNFIEKNNLSSVIDFKINPANKGYASNFVGALRETSGDYIFFCDQDDIWCPDRVENMVKALETHPDAMLIGSEFEPFKSSADAPDVPAWELKKFKNDDSMEKLSFNSENIFIGCQGCTMAMRRSFIDRVDKYWYEGWAHDEFVWKLALSMGGLYFYHRVTLKRRLHSDNVTLHKEHKKEQRLKYLTELKKSHERTLKFLVENGRTDSGEVSLMKRHIRATDLRIGLIRDKKIINTFILLAYTDCYHKKRSIPVELLMVFK